jgi:hypothetical protein
MNLERIRTEPRDLGVPGNVRPYASMYHVQCFRPRFKSRVVVSFQKGVLLILRNAVAMRCNENREASPLSPILLSRRWL